MPGQRRKLTKKKSTAGSFYRKSKQNPTHYYSKFAAKVKLMKMFFAKSDRLQAPSPAGFIQILKENQTWTLA